MISNEFYSSSLSLSVEAFEEQQQQIGIGWMDGWMNALFCWMMMIKSQSNQGLMMDRAFDGEGKRVKQGDLHTVKAVRAGTRNIDEREPASERAEGVNERVNARALSSTSCARR